MRILVVYGTTEGQTRKIASLIAERASKQGHAVTSLDASELPPSFDIAAFDAVIVAGSVRLGHYQAAVGHFVQQQRDMLKCKLNAFVSVSLSAASKDDVESLKKCLADFLAQTGWTPGRIHHAAGAFRFTQYDWLRTWAMKYIAYRKGVKTGRGGDIELTDWDALGRFVDDFLAEASTISLR